MAHADFVFYFADHGGHVIGCRWEEKVSVARWSCTRVAPWEKGATVSDYSHVMLVTRVLITPSLSTFLDCGVL
ncbi:hypothetical protein SERLA73DRAFT_189247 [Serpula lacrymans var. lacrymans S7.3]|uniref:Uncharacterized protein n=2 Tax=Serpula lacrymans var. lacrymans TaxID=341189 RepID=F8QD70_SERL3|nr:uncharacterized protein SERLADRAFT_479977 [Serpula lacrymans var. lacrymans S7.9]EGN93541.1 hypothetical protein SERLA73DRAFT_189247 [Serpula lacrymans var. lacrymans S7.3]EGO18918.1 hypothetical protein SERLADRAFT_479977 [Serpula lacrymans var. lacrymans S7.9]